MIRKPITIGISNGLEARPIALLVQVASQYASSIYLENEERPILSLANMRSIEEKLPNEQFMRVHRSFIVQKQKIKIIEKGRIIFGKNYIPISDSYKQELLNYVNKHTI